MTLTFKVASLLSSLAAAFMTSGDTNHTMAPRSTDMYAATSCKTGFKKGKTPLSLTIGGKVGCYDVKLAAAGKKLLTGMSNTCFACHTAAGITPFSQMNANLRLQGYTLAPAQIVAAFEAHKDEMSGASIASKDAKALSHFLQSIK